MPKLPTPPLSETQLGTLAVIQALKDAKGYAPSLHELAKELGVFPSAARSRLLRLRARDCVTWTDGKSRTLTLTARGVYEATEAKANSAREHTATAGTHLS